MSASTSAGAHEVPADIAAGVDPGLPWALEPGAHEPRTGRRPGATNTPPTATTGRSDDAAGTTSRPHLSDTLQTRTSRPHALAFDKSVDRGLGFGGGAFASDNDGDDVDPIRLPLTLGGCCALAPSQPFTDLRAEADYQRFNATPQLLTLLLFAGLTTAVNCFFFVVILATAGADGLEWRKLRHVVVRLAACPCILVPTLAAYRYWASRRREVQDAAAGVSGGRSGGAEHSGTSLASDAALVSPQQRNPMKRESPPPFDTPVEVERYRSATARFLAVLVVAVFAITRTASVLLNPPHACEDVHPAGGDPATACEQSISIIDVVIAPVTIALVRHPHDAAAVCGLHIAAYVPLAFALRGADALPWAAARAAMLAGVYAVAVAIVAGRDRRARAHYAAMALSHAAQRECEAARQRALAMLRALLPPAVVQRAGHAEVGAALLADPRAGAAALAAAVADAADGGAAVLVTAVLDLRGLERRFGARPHLVLAALARLFALFDIGAQVFGVDRGMTSGDAYVATAGLVRGSGATVARLVRYALWQHATVTDARSPRRTEQLPPASTSTVGSPRAPGGFAVADLARMLALRSGIATGSAAARTAGDSGALRYEVRGSALEAALLLSHHAGTNATCALAVDAATATALDRNGPSGIVSVELTASPNHAGTFEACAVVSVTAPARLGLCDALVTDTLQLPLREDGAAADDSRPNEAAAEGVVVAAAQQEADVTSVVDDASSQSNKETTAAAANRTLTAFAGFADPHEERRFRAGCVPRMWPCVVVAAVAAAVLVPVANDAAAPPPALVATVAAAVTCACTSFVVSVCVQWRQRQETTARDAVSDLVHALHLAALSAAVALVGVSHFLSAPHFSRNSALGVMGTLWLLLAYEAFVPLPWVAAWILGYASGIAVVAPAIRSPEQAGMFIAACFFAAFAAYDTGRSARLAFAACSAAAADEAVLKTTAGALEALARGLLPVDVPDDILEGTVADAAVLARCTRSTGTSANASLSEDTSPSDGAGDASRSHGRVPSPDLAAVAACGFSASSPEAVPAPAPDGLRRFPWCVVASFNVTSPSGPADRAATRAVAAAVDRALAAANATHAEMIAELEAPPKASLRSLAVGSVSPSAFASLAVANPLVAMEHEAGGSGASVASIADSLARMGIGSVRDNSQRGRSDQPLELRRCHVVAGRIRIVRCLGGTVAVADPLDEDASPQAVAVAAVCAAAFAAELARAASAAGLRVSGALVAEECAGALLGQGACRYGVHGVATTHAAALADAAASVAGPDDSRREQSPSPVAMFAATEHFARELAEGLRLRGAGHAVGDNAEGTALLDAVLPVGSHARHHRARWYVRDTGGVDVHVLAASTPDRHAGK